MPDEIQLLQLFICHDFRQDKQDHFTATGIHSNLYVAKFPFHFKKLYVITCWKKDKRFHKEVIEYVTEEGRTSRSPHMDIEPITDSVLFRWHKHPFPTDFHIDKPTTLTVRVILDAHPKFESHFLIEKTPG